MSRKQREAALKHLRSLMAANGGVLTMEAITAAKCPRGVTSATIDEALVELRRGQWVRDDDWSYRVRAASPVPTASRGSGLGGLGRGA